MEIIHLYGNYSIRYSLPLDAGDKGAFNQFIIPETNITDRDNIVIKVIHGEKNFTRQCWADLCRERSYQGNPVAGAALIYGGEIKSPGKIILSDGTWYEHSEKHTGYLTVDGGSVCEQFTGSGEVVKLWDPEPEPEPVVTVPEPDAPISLASIIPEEEDIPFEEDPELVALRKENAEMKAKLAESTAKAEIKKNKAKVPKVNADK